MGAEARELGSRAAIGPKSRAVAHALALLAVVFTWPLLLVGGAVSVHRVGMAVPDWPTTFGINMFYYNLFEAPWGVFAEHAHRLYGSAVGMVCIALVAGFGLARFGLRGLIPVIAAVAAAVVAALNPGGRFLGLERGLAGLAAVGFYSLVLALWFGAVRRDLLMSLVWLALAAVVGQGVLGGMRVRLNSTILAFVHGWTAQVFFALMVVLWVVTSRRWAEAGRSEAIGGGAKRRAAVLVGLVFAQVVAGAYVRHYGTLAAVAVHGVLAAGVLAHVALISRDSEKMPRGFGVRSASLWMSIWLAVQMVLGLAALIVLSPFDGVPRAVEAGPAWVRVGHQGVGALLLATCVVYALRIWRHAEAGERVAESAIVGTASGMRRLEALT